MTQAVGGDYVMDAKRDRLVITASALGTVFEWYDFYIYGVLAPIIGRTFFPTDNPTVELLYSLAGFAIGFGFRPLGAMLFGYLGDRLGRKYTFLATIILMGLATAGVGLTPSAASIGVAAPVILILLRIAQGLALGGEYGGAAIYVAEHAPAGKRGFYTSFIQAGVIGGFILSLIVVVGTQWIVGMDVWDAWGWRIPFIFSLALLAISLWMRLMLRESPVFTAMKKAGQQAKNPLKEAFTAPGNRKRMLVAMIGPVAGRRQRLCRHGELHLLWLAVRPGRAQEADRHRLCAGVAARHAALPVYGRDREPGADAGGGAGAGNGERRRGPFRTLRQGSADRRRQAAR